MNEARQVNARRKTPPDASITLSSRSAFARWAPIALRLIVGYGFMAHGFAKLGRGADSFATILGAMGVPAPYFMSWATIFIEIFGGLAILLGAFVVFMTCRWRRFCWWRCSPCTCRTASARSSSSP
jgi:hypothetical protein